MPSGAFGERGEFGQRIFVRILGMDGFAPVESDGHVADAGHVVFGADQVHFDAPERPDIAGFMAEACWPHFGIQLAADTLQNIQVKGGGNAKGIVVGGV